MIPNFLRIKAFAPDKLGFDHNNHLDQKPGVVGSFHRSRVLLSPRGITPPCLLTYSFILSRSPCLV
jgi:hypothetical protein